jgi:CheY-like chemotaxis protein
VDTAADGEEGFKLFEKGKYAVVVTDLNMPKMSGRQLIHKIRQTAPTQKIFVYTAESLDEEQRQKTGADRCFEPNEYQQLKKALTELRRNIT